MLYNQPNMPKLKIAFILFSAICIVSFAAILIKLAGEASALVIATYRLTLATLLLAPLVLLQSRRELLSLSKKEWLLSLLSGAFLSLHFFTWVSSLKYTSVASSVVLVTTNPIFIGLGSYFLLKERLRALLVAGIGLSVTGGILIGYGDFRVGNDVLLGDLLALTGAIMASGYFLIGRRVRQKLALLPYIFIVYGMAALILLGLSLLTHQQFFGYSRSTYFWLVLMAVGPQLIGHTSVNWALKYVSAATVAVAILGEPVGSTILAYLILKEGLTPLKLVGGLLILLGIYMAARAETMKK